MKTGQALSNDFNDISIQGSGLHACKNTSSWPPTYLLYPPQIVHTPLVKLTDLVLLFISQWVHMQFRFQVPDEPRGIGQVTGWVWNIIVDTDSLMTSSWTCTLWLLIIEP